MGVLRAQGSFWGIGYVVYPVHFLCPRKSRHTATPSPSNRAARSIIIPPLYSSGASARHSSSKTRSSPNHCAFATPLFAPSYPSTGPCISATSPNRHYGLLCGLHGIADGEPSPLERRLEAWDGDREAALHDARVRCQTRTGTPSASSFVHLCGTRLDQESTQTHAPL